MDDLILRLENIYKSYPNSPAPVLNGISLSVAQGQFVTLLGSSGCGKTTTLRIISGLDAPDSGQVILAGQDMSHVPPNARDVNTVFQSYALFPHMTVEQNVGYSLRLRRLPKAEIRQQVREALAMVQLEGFEKRRPSQLSGGQSQRVALARSIISHPRLLLLDEPLSALDYQLRQQMQQELKRLQKQLGISFIYITHDREEALNMSDVIAVMRDGAFEQVGTPEEVFDSPRTSYVAKFVGGANILHCHVERVEGQTAWFQNAQGSGAFSTRGHSFSPGQNATLAIRPDQAQAEKDFDKSAPGLVGTVKEKSFAGGVLRVAAEFSGGQTFVCSRQGIDWDLAPGDQIKISWAPEQACPVDWEALDEKEN